MTGARVHRLHVSLGGVPKHPVTEAVVGRDGIVGDGHNDKRHHGGPQRALCLYALSRIEALRAEGHPILPGAVGENVTIDGLEWSQVTPGRRLTIGAVQVEITSYTSPCRTIQHAFRDEKFARIAHDRHPGDSRVYARVLREGIILVGDPVVLHPDRPDGARVKGASNG